MTTSRKRNLYITSGKSSRPHANRAIFCDGGVDDTFRPGVDLELSHWIPNSTPAQFKTSTSTEICMRFVATDNADDFDLVVNNHIDVDGVLSTFVLLYPDVSLQYRDTLVQAAEIGDFWGWGEPPAQHLFQALACLMTRLREQRADPLDVYMQCYERVHAALAGERFPECAPGLQSLRASVARIDNRVVTRTLIAPRLVHYSISQQAIEDDLGAALLVPAHNAPFPSAAILLPHARARYDRERAHLVSVETTDGIYYDLWYPGYTWAETVQLWRPPGVRSAGNSNVHYLQYAPLETAATELQRLETADGRWSLTRKLSPFATLPSRNFPVILSFVKDAAPVPSALPHEIVTQILAKAFGQQC